VLGRAGGLERPEIVFMFASPQIWDVAEGEDLCTTKLKNANMSQIPLPDLLRGDP
jgi:hypothetical protein